MTECSEFTRPRLDGRALLGLHDPTDGTDWAPIRAAQINAGASLALFLVAANVVGAALVILILHAVVPMWQLAAWGAGVAAVSACVSFRRLSARSRAVTAASLSDVRDTVLEGIALGSVWSIPAIGFGVAASLDAAFGLFVILALMMTASATAMAALPLATLAFLGIVGASVAVMLFILGGAVFAAAALVLTALLMLVCVGRGTSLVVIRAGEIALAEREETVSLLLREFEEASADWLWEVDAARRVIRASPRFVRSIGLEPGTINGMPFLQALAGDAWQTGDFAGGLRLLADKLKAREPFGALMVPVTVGGEQRWWEMSGSPRHDEDGQFVGFRGVGSDVTEQRASADKISRLARFDTLTGLPNRLMISETLAQALADADRWGSRCAFMMVDLDRFKAVNDTLGHPIGDRLLKRVAERLGQLVSANEIIGRLGGDEFAVVVRDASDTQRVETLAESICDLLGRPYELDQHTLYIGASVGVATGPRDGRTSEMLVRSADLALYKSKDAGRGVVRFYEPQLHVEAEARRVLEMALRGAMANGEFHLAYQPVVDAAAGRLTGFEALLRWNNPVHGAVSPAQFVPIAEEARLIAPIGEWVLRTACEEAARWATPARIAVNVSPEQLHSPSFVTVVASALANSGLSPERLELEVTESVFLREGTCAVQVLERILDLGVRLSLDDFGTGYSSLGYLSRTRFSSIKIDRSFVTQAARGVREAVAIIRAVVALADSLGMATTAEGVETENEHRMVQAFGCTKVQGYYFGRPLPVLEARALAGDRRSTAVAA